jgi:hypothetical protein
METRINSMRNCLLAFGLLWIFKTVCEHYHYFTLFIAAAAASNNGVASSIERECCVIN